MPRSRFTRSSICTLLGVVLVLAYFTATPARAGRDQLWFTDHVTSDGTRADIRSILNGNCLDASGASAANGTRVQAWECKVQDESGINPVGWAQAWNQRWRVNDPNSGGYWAGACDATRSINYQGEPYCGLDVVNGDYSDRLWFSIAVGDNWGACIDVPGGIDANGQNLQIYECNGTPAQVWRIGNDAWGESLFWIRSNITGQGTNRCWTNWFYLVLYDCAYDF